jgi:hypothetical protein
MSNEMKPCVQECLECHQLCLETIQYCLSQGGNLADADHIRLLADCAEICQTSANFMLRDSDLHMIVCEACAEICQQCFESCNRQKGDSQMKACAAACRQCAEACQQMAV